MLRLLMSPQIYLALEGTAAQVAGEGLEPRVFAAVCDQIGGLAESFAADLALVRLLP